jgi:protein TonB
LGTVTIKLVISPSGGLASAEIVRSSGNRRLDDIALASVHKAALRAPPSGMTLTELTYEVPYHFR